ncbi:unnamed protein product [Malus baccata var. baccata]
MRKKLTRRVLWYCLVCERDETGWNGMGRDETRRNGEGAKMPLDVNKEEEEGDGEVIILCSMDVERVILGGDVERKFTQNSSRGTTRFTRFRHTKRGTEPLVPLRSVPSHVPNGSLII